MPIAYIDVSMYSDTIVKGYCNHVDCWYTDEAAGQIPGPCVGKTTFNLRLPWPKLGWVIQIGRPTKIERNSKRPKYIWVEEWRHMTRKGQNQAIARWESLKPRIDHARDERGLRPIQKNNQEFWEAIKQATEQHRPHVAPGMPLMEVKPEVNLAANVQQFSVFQGGADELNKNTGELKRRIAFLEAQVPPGKVGEAHSEVPQRPHEENIDFPA